MNPVFANLPAGQRRKLKKMRQPVFVTPMKATLTESYFDDPGWLYERKLDGVRCLITVRDGDVTLYSRNRKRKNDTYPEVVEAMAALPGDFVVDAELVTFSRGVTDFSRLQDRIHVKQPDDELLRSVPVVVYLFDILFCQGYDLRPIPLRSRKKVLKSVFDFEDPVRYLPHRNERGQAFLKQACDKGWEGVIAKDASAPYESRRSTRWLKFKCQRGQELVIGGYTRPRGSRVGFGALLVGYYEGDRLRYAGRVGTGFTDSFLRTLHRRLAHRKRQTCPFRDFQGSDEDVTWVSPQLVGEFGFTEWTEDGKLRHPRFLGLRDDKKPRDVVREAS